MSARTNTKGAEKEFEASQTVAETPTASTETHTVETLEHDEITLSAPAAETFSPGAVVYDGSFALSDGKEPLEVTLVSISKFFMENVPFGDDRIPNTLATKQAVHALGKTTTWSNEDGEKRSPDYLPVIDIHVLVAKPDELRDPDAEGLFMLEGPDGLSYGLAKMRLKKTSHSAAGRTIVSAMKFGGWETPAEASFLLTAPQRTFGKNRVHVATAKRGPKHDAEFVTWVSRLASELI